MFLGVDQSKRSTGVVLLNAEGNLEDFMLISPPKEMDGVELIAYQWDLLNKFLGNGLKILDGALIEGLSFGAIGGAKDLLAGLNWYFRVEMSRLGYFLGTVPVTMWRSKVVHKDEAKEAKALGKDGIKKVTVSKVPIDILEKFQSYVVKNGCKKDAIYDLVDAYFIAKHSFGLHKTIDK